LQRDETLLLPFDREKILRREFSVRFLQRG